MPGGQHGLGVGRCLLVVHRRDLPCIGLEHLPVRSQQDREETGLIGGLRRDAPLAKEVLFPAGQAVRGKVAGGGLPLSRVILGESPVVGVQQGQHGVGVGYHLMIAHQIDSAQDYQQHKGQGEHTGGNKLAAQAFDHDCSSSA